PGRVQAGGAARVRQGPAIGGAGELSPGCAVGLRRCGAGADRGCRYDRAGAAAAPGGSELAAGIRDRGDTVARGHGRPRHRAADPADAVHERGQSGGRAAHALPGGLEPLSSARRQLAAAGGRCPRQRAAMTRRITVFLIVCFVVGAVVAVYYMPQWRPQQTQAGAKGSKGGGAGGRVAEAVPVLVAAAKTADVPVYLDGVGTAKALNTVIVRPQVDGKLINISFREGQDVEKGYILAKIDPVTYQAAYDQTVAK